MSQMGKRQSADGQKKKKIKRQRSSLVHIKPELIKQVM